MEGRYWFDNSLADEGARLRLLEAIADPRSIRLLEDPVSYTHLDVYKRQNRARSQAIGS